MTYRVFARSAKGTTYRFRVTANSAVQLNRVLTTLRTANNYTSLVFKRLETEK